MSNKVYNTIKWVTMIVLPAAGAFYFTLAQIWSLPAAEEVLGTLAALTTLLGALVGVSTSQYNKRHIPTAGTLNIDTSDPEVDKYSMDFSVALNKLPEAKSVTLTVNHQNKSE